MFKILTIFLVTSTILIASPPQWYSTQNLPHTQSQIIGYGQAKELNIAKQNAKSEIAEMIQTNIDSITIIDIDSSTDKYDKDVNRTIKTSSSVRLNGLRVLKQERVDDVWFVAIVYDNLPLTQKIINSINPKRENFNHPYLTHTTLFKALKEHFGFYPKAEIYAQNGQYYIAIDNQQFLISQQEFVELFSNQEHQNIKIKLKDRLKNNDLYFVDTEFKEFGFASLFLVSHTGTVVSMFRNIELIDATFTYPNKKEYDGLRAEIENGAKQSRDMFVALLCKKKEDIGLFNQVSTELEKDSFRFGNLLDLMGRCAFSTKILTIVE